MHSFSKEEAASRLGALPAADRGGGVDANVQFRFVAALAFVEPRG